MKTCHACGSVAGMNLHPVASTLITHTGTTPPVPASSTAPASKNIDMLRQARDAFAGANNLLNTARFFPAQYSGAALQGAAMIRTGSTMLAAADPSLGVLASQFSGDATMLLTTPPNSPQFPALIAINFSNAAMALQLIDSRLR